MSITPTDTAVSAIGAGSAPTGTTDPASAGDFLAAILQALAPGAGQASGQAGEQATGDGTASADPAVATDPAALGLVVPPGLAAQLVPPAPLPTADGGGAADGADAAVDALVAPGHANVAAGAAVGTTGPTGDIRMSGDAVAIAAPLTTTTEQTGPATRDAEARTSDRAGAGPATPDPTAVTSAAATAQAGTDAGGSMPDPSTAPASIAPVSAPPAPVVSRAEAASTSGPHHVTGQVFPEVTRLVSRGDGTHRITLDLNPESLGEVRVVMTVRDGAVHVRFAAGHEAGRALLDGSAELNRLLGAAGASETRIVVRDLAATQPAAATADGTTTGGDPGLGPGGHRSQDQHAGTRAEHHATDGSDTTTPGTRGAGANPPRSIQPVTRTRTAGVDVTM